MSLLFEEESEIGKRNFSINGIIITVDPTEWPENSMPRLLYEGDKKEDTYIISNAIIKKKTIKLIRAVITKNMNFPVIEKIDWENLKITVEYLGLGVGVDYIYPLFLTSADKPDWYEQCRMRRTYICSYKPDAQRPSSFGVSKNPKELLEVTYDEIKLNDPPDYDVLGEIADYCDRWSVMLNEEVQSKFVFINYIISRLSSIPNLFVAGGIALALFRQSNSLRDYHDIDIFAYGDNALKNIKEGVKICMEMAKEHEPRIDFDYNNIRYGYVPVRTKYSITVMVSKNLENIDVESIDVQFILFKSNGPHEILSRFDVDSCTVGFDMSEPNKFYALPRFLRAMRTMTNVIDPTRQSPTYIKRLMKYSNRGFRIAVPGLDINNLIIDPYILNKMATANRRKITTLHELHLTGLESLIVHSIVGHPPAYVKSYSHISRMEAPGVLVTLLQGIDYRDAEDVDFVVGNVLNESSDYFSFNTENKELKYKPKYPKIQLMDRDPQNEMVGSIHQVKTSFYGMYYGV